MPRDIVPTGPLPSDHPTVKARKIGVLLIALGTPDGTDYFSMRRYLKEFLSDRRVIEVNPIFWQLLLNTIILTFRPSKSGAAYRSIWNTEKDESPLRTITRDQSEGVAAYFAERHGDRVVVDWGMRYGNPPIRERLEALQAQGCDRILLFPLYPQYSASTMASACDQSFRALMKMRWQPAVRTVPAYHDHPAYIDALAESIETHLAGLDWTPQAVVASYHGLPKSYFMKGDPYHCHCMKTTRLLRERLGWDADRLIPSFQSRFGPQEWLTPYTVEKVAELAKAGVHDLAVIAPGFSADCVETLEEIHEEIGDAFKEAGGKRFSYIPCLNASVPGLALLGRLAEAELAGWLPETGVAAPSRPVEAAVSSDR